MTNKKPSDYQSLNAELDELLQAMESGDLSVEQMMAHFEKGQALVKELDKQLKAAELKITKLKLKKQ